MIRTTFLSALFLALTAQAVSAQPTPTDGASKSPDGTFITWPMGMTWATSPPPHPHGVHWDGNPPPHPQIAGGVTYYGGAVMPVVHAQALFWGPYWTNASNAEVITGIDSWYNGVGDSSFVSTADEYLSMASPIDPNTVTYSGHFVDTSWEPQTTMTSKIVATQICADVNAGNLQLAGDGSDYVAVYGMNYRNTEYFCAYHGAATCNVNGKNVDYKFGFFFAPDSGCSAFINEKPRHFASDLAALADLSGQQLNNVRTDPYGTGWHDASGDEIAQKCRFTVGMLFPYVTFTNGSEWREHGTWSNAAYDSGSGAPNRLGDPGCIFGY